MEALKIKLYNKAIIKHGFHNVNTLTGKKLDECFSILLGRLTFWFDDKKGSTHMVQDN